MKKMRRTSLKRKSKSEIRKVQDLLWEECKRIKRGKRETIDCYTCYAKDLIGSNCQLGHMWAKASVSAMLKYHLDILEFQCMRCNIHLGGQGAVFFERKQRELGEERIAELSKMKNQPILVNALDYYKSLIEKYSLENTKV